MYARCAASSSSVVAPLASAPDGPTHTAIGTRERLIARTMSRTPASIAPPESTWKINIVEWRAFARVIASRTSDSLGGSNHPSTVTTSMPPLPFAAAGSVRALAPAIGICASKTSSRQPSASATNAPTRRTRRARGDRRAGGAPVASLTMDLERFCATSRVVIVAGKGGVGKTTVTAALAVAAARAGLRVLILEVEGKSGLAGCFGRPPLAYDEAEMAPGVRARTLTPDDALVEYLEDHGLRRIGRRLASSGALEVVATAVPGMKDILVLGKVKQLERAGAADLILVDAPAAGHAVSFLLSARGLLDAVRVGPIRKQATDVVELLSDPARCQVMLVTVPEETPVTELVETALAIEDRAGVALGPVVVNGCVEPVAGLQAEPFSGEAAADGDGARSWRPDDP